MTPIKARYFTTKKRLAHRRFKLDWTALGVTMAILISKVFRHNKLINRRKRKRKSAHSPDTTGTSGPADLEETEFDMTPR
jgi:hypothetical protein